MSPFFYFEIHDELCSPIGITNTDQVPRPRLKSNSLPGCGKNCCDEQLCVLNEGKTRTGNKAGLRITKYSYG